MISRETFLIGDIHGCLYELERLLSTINYNSKNIRLIFLGDLLDRGPESVKCVQLVRDLCEQGAECLTGNHENKHVRFRGHEIKKALTGKHNPMRMSPHDKKAHDDLTDDDINWMRKLPVKIHIKHNWWAIHGGLEPAYDFHDQNPAQIIQCRYVHKKSLKAVSVNRTQISETSVYWTDAWDGPQSIVYGHAVHSLHTPLIDERPRGIRCVGIDTGAVFGGHLTGFFLERNIFVKIKAKKEYYHIDAIFND